MGRPVGIDSMLFVYYFEGTPKLVDYSEKVLAKIKEGHQEGVMSLIGIIEIITGPKRLKNFALAQRYKNLIATFPHLTIVNLNDNIVELASDLRGKYGIATPDAIHIATAIDARAAKFVTNDRDLKRVKEIRVGMLG